MEKLTNNIEKMYNKMSDKKILDNFSKELKIK